MLRKIGIISVLSLIVVALTASVAMAQNPQLKQKQAPTAEDLGKTLQVTGTLVGLGQEGGTVEVEAVGVATTACENPGSKSKQPPGLVRENVLVGGEQTFTAEDVTRSGQFTFNVVTEEPPVGTCPGKQTPVLVDVEFTSFELFVTTFSGERVSLGTFQV